MEDKKHEQDRLEKEMRVFRHKGKLHYSYRGHLISCKKYAFYKSLGKDRDTIMFEYAEAYNKLFRKQDEEREKEKVHIHSIHELMKYILNQLLCQKERENLRKQYKKEMTIEERIKLFPPVYQNVLRMYLAHAEKNEKLKQAEMKSLEKAIVGSLPDTPETKTYNPDAFIETGNEELPLW